jgi:hypothetical protein
VLAVLCGVAAVRAPAEGPANARKALLAKGLAQRERLKRSPAAFRKASVLYYKGRGEAVGAASIIRYRGREYFLTATAAYGAGKSARTFEASFAKPNDRVRIGLGKAVYRRNGVCVLPVARGERKYTALTYAGPQLLNVGDGLAVLTRDGPQLGKLSDLSMSLVTRVLPGEPTPRPVTMGIGRPFAAGKHTGAPVVLVETGTVIGVLVGGTVMSGQTWAQLELLHFGREEPAEPIGKAVFGLPVPPGLPARHRTSHVRLFPAAVSRFGVGATHAELIAARPYLHAEEGGGWENIGRRYLFDSASYAWDGGKVTKVLLETVGSRARTPGDVETGKAAMAWCLAVFGPPATAIYRNRRELLGDRLAYHLCYVWRTPTASVFFNSTIAGPELRCTLAVVPKGTELKAVLPVVGLGKQVDLKPLDLFTATEFHTQWMTRLFSAQPKHPLYKGEAETGR